MDPLNLRHCVPCEGKAKPLSRGRAQVLRQEVPEWTLNEEGTCISREFDFKTFPKAIEFINQVADVAEYEDHHPDIHLFYTHLKLELSTHAIKGLSENDFILAAKINQLTQFQ